jgi:hypothetical protein
LLKIWAGMKCWRIPGRGLDPLLKALNHCRFQAHAKMFEIGVISIVVLAVGYWVTLWLMGRHEDVLHGDFIHTEPGADTAPAFPALVFPAKPTFPVKPPAAKPAALKPVSTETLPASVPPPSPAGPAPSDTLQSLLASIKRDLKDASQL